jgi:hypothetical protein
MPITYAPTTSVDFSLTLALGNPPQSVTIYAADLDSVATKGLHFALPPGTVVTLGTLNTLITWLNAQLAAAGISVTIPTTAGTDWPTVIQNVFNGILNTEVTVTLFILDQDPKDADGNYPPLRFSLDVTGTALDAQGKPTPISIIDGLFAVSGGGIGLTRTYPGAPTLVSGQVVPQIAPAQPAQPAQPASQPASQPAG